MADVMDERVRSIEFCAGLGFTLGALFLSLSLCLYPRLAPANQTNLILDALSKVVSRKSAEKILSHLIATQSAPPQAG